MISAPKMATLNEEVRNLNAYHFINRRPKIQNAIAKSLLQVLNEPRMLEAFQKMTVQEFSLVYYQWMSENMPKEIYVISMFVIMCNQCVPDHHLTKDHLLLTGVEDIPISLLLGKTFACKRVVKTLKLFTPESSPDEGPLSHKILTLFKEKMVGTLEEVTSSMLRSYGSLTLLSAVREIGKLDITCGNFLEAICSVLKEPELRRTLQMELTWISELEEAMMIRTGKGSSVKLSPLRASLFIARLDEIDRGNPLFESVRPILEKMVKEDPHLTLMAKDRKVMFSIICRSFLVRSVRSEKYLKLYNRIVDVTNQLSSPDMHTVLKLFYLIRSLPNVNEIELSKALAEHTVVPDLLKNPPHTGNSLISLTLLKPGTTPAEVAAAFGKLGADKKFLELYLNSRDDERRVLGYIDTNIEMFTFCESFPLSFAILLNLLLVCGVSYGHVHCIWYVLNKNMECSEDPRVVLGGFNLANFLEVLDELQHNLGRAIVFELQYATFLETKYAKGIPEVKAEKVVEKSVDQLMKELGLEDEPKKGKREKVGKAPPREPKNAAKPKMRPAPVAAPVAAPVDGTPSVEEDKDICVVCLDATRTHVLINCGHFHYCGTCVKLIKRCSICRSEDISSIRVYM